MRKFFFDYDSRFSELMRKVADTFMINLFILLGSFPLVTLGLSLSAALETWFTLQAGTTRPLYAIFWSSYKKQIKPPSLVPVFYLFWILIIAFDLIYVHSTDTYLDQLTIVFWMAGILCLSFFVTSCAILAKYETRIKSLLKNSVLLTFKYVYVIPCIVLPILIFYFLVRISSPFFLSMLIFIGTFFGLGLFTYYLSIRYRKIFNKNDASIHQPPS